MTAHVKAHTGTEYEHSVLGSAVTRTTLDQTPSHPHTCLMLKDRESHPKLKEAVCTGPRLAPGAPDSREVAQPLHPRGVQLPDLGGKEAHVPGLVLHPPPSPTLLQDGE